MNCPECNTEMEDKYVSSENENGGRLWIYQCPKCKNIEVDEV